MNTNIITCPKCKASIPLTDAMAHQVREQMQEEFAAKARELLGGVEAREVELARKKTELEAEQSKIDQLVTDKLAAERKRIEEEAQQRAKQGLGMEMQDLRTQLDERKDQLAQSQRTELELRRKQRELEERAAEMDLQVARQLGEERARIAQEAHDQAVEAGRLKMCDKDNVIRGLNEQIRNLQLRSEQGSIQAQGETLELDLESRLRAAFRYDDIAEVKKGQRGADVHHQIRTNTGMDCGSILWEAKRAKNWSADWPEKLKEDQRSAKAELAVIVTTCLPEGIRGIGQVDGVWVCEPQFAMALGMSLRQGLMSTAAQRLQQANRADKMSLLYDHVCSVEFRQHIEAIVESFLGMKTQIESERRAFTKQWKEREQQLEKAITHTAILYGGVQGIAGREALPEIRTFQLNAGEGSEAAVRKPVAPVGVEEARDL